MRIGQRRVRKGLESHIRHICGEPDGAFARLNRLRGFPRLRELLGHVEGESCQPDWIPQMLNDGLCPFEVRECSSLLYQRHEHIPEVESNVDGLLQCLGTT